MPTHIKFRKTTGGRVGSARNPIVIDGPMRRKPSRGGAPRRNQRTAGFLGIENKFIDYTYTDSAIEAAQAGSEADPATVNCLNAIAQGDGESNRDGRKCVLTSVHVRGKVTKPQTSTTANAVPTIVRVALVMDTQTNGAQLNAEDVFLAATNPEGAFRNLQYSKRFKVLKDQVFEIQPASAAGNGTTNVFNGESKYFAWNVKLGTPVIFNGTTANVSTITDNSLHVIAFADNAFASLEYESRVRFQG